MITPDNPASLEALQQQVNQLSAHLDALRDELKAERAVPDIAKLTTEDLLHLIAAKNGLRRAQVHLILNP